MYCTVRPSTNEHVHGSLHATSGCEGVSFLATSSDSMLAAFYYTESRVKPLATGKPFQLLSHLHGIVSRFSHLIRIACSPELHCR